MTRLSIYCGLPSRMVSKDDIFTGDLVSIRNSNSINNV